MAEVPVRKERFQERSLFSRGEKTVPSAPPPPRLDEASTNPWALMRQFSEEMERLFRGTHEAGGFWSPNVDVRERETDLVVSADLPGISPSDVRVEVTGEGLLIQGERRVVQEERHKGYYRSERSYGSFSRLIALPEGANLDQAKAQFQDGVLEVVVPLTHISHNRREIPIEMAPRTRTSGGGA